MLFEFYFFFFFILSRPPSSSQTENGNIIFHLYILYILNCILFPLFPHFSSPPIFPSSSFILLPSYGIFYSTTSLLFSIYYSPFSPLLPPSPPLPLLFPLLSPFHYSIPPLLLPILSTSPVPSFIIHLMSTNRRITTIQLSPVPFLHYFLILWNCILVILLMLVSEVRQSYNSLSSTPQHRPLCL